MLKKLPTYLLVAIIIFLGSTQSPPIWPEQFTVDFYEVALLITKGTTKGTIYYDAKNNREVIFRESGGHDRYCGTVFKWVETPCNHIVIDNKRYLDFPQKQYCCFCCDSTHGCGITRPDWMKGATYLGLEQIDTQGPYLKWDTRGGQENYYYHKNDAFKTPRRLYQYPDDLMDFENYRPYVDSRKFEIPTYCNTKCGAGTTCPAIRGETSQSLTKEAKE